MPRHKHLGIWLDNNLHSKHFIKTLNANLREQLLGFSVQRLKLITEMWLDELECENLYSNLFWIMELQCTEIPTADHHSAREHFFDLIDMIL